MVRYLMLYQIWTDRTVSNNVKIKKIATKTDAINHLSDVTIKKLLKIKQLSYKIFKYANKYAKVRTNKNFITQQKSLYMKEHRTVRRY